MRPTFGSLLQVKWSRKAVAPGPILPPPGRSDRAARHAVETFLIAQARFKELRVMRRLASVSAGSKRRVRRRQEAA